MNKDTGPESTRGTIPGIAAASLFAAILLIANIPGSPMIGPDILSDGKYGPHFECGIQSMVHGWPFAFLEHDGHFTPWDDGPSAWIIGDSAQFALGAFAADIALLIAGTLAVGWAVRSRIQMSGWRFGLIHLLVAIGCASAVAAYIGSQYRLHQAQHAYLQRGGGQNFMLAESQPYGPYWLRRISGPDCWSWGDRLVAADIWTANEIADLPGKRAIKVLQIITVDCDAMPSLEAYENLLAIDMFMVNYDYSEFRGEGHPDFAPCLRVIAQCDSLQGLNLYDTGVTDRGLQELARMPNLINLELSRNPDITDAGLDYLASIRSLKKLSLWEASVTKEGVEKLQTALPDCEIRWDGMSR